MNKVTLPFLPEGYLQTVLPNGLRLRVIPRKDFAKKYAFLAVDYGAMDMEFSLHGKVYSTPAGVAHFLEHKMFDMPYGDAMNRFAALGGNPNAFTSHSITAYYVSCTENLEENLRTLTEMVFTPYFSQKSVDKEQGIIAEEIRMYRDSADSRVYENLFAAMFHQNPVRVPVIGTEESIATITEKTLHQCHSAFYTPANAMLCVMGDVDADEVLRWTMDSTPATAGEKATALYPQEPLNVKETITEDRMEVSMPTFVAGFKGVPTTGKDAMKQEFTLDLAADCLLGTSAPLYTDLYEQGLIDGSFSAGFEGMKGVSVFTFGGDSRNPQAVTERIMRAVEDLRRTGMDEAQFLRQKKATMGRRLRDLDGFESTCYRSADYFFHGGEYFDFYDVMQSIIVEDVTEALIQFVREDAMCLSLIQPAN